MARRLDRSLSHGVGGDLPVYERRLDNGLKALVLPRRRRRWWYPTFTIPWARMMSRPG